MPQINLNLSKKLFSPTLFPLLFDYSHRWEVYLGGAGSGKSYFITQKLIVRACREKIRILVCRRYGSTIRNTCFALFKEVLTKWKLLPYVKIRETDFHIQFPNGSEIIFTGLDEETKLLSLFDIGCVFIEEVFEVPKETVEQLNIRMRANVENPQILMAFNPISQQHWLYEFCEVKPPQSFYFSKTTFRDNPFLSPEYIASLEELLQRNPAKARVYTEGLWGTPVEGLVLTNWSIKVFNPLALVQKGFERRTGMDFGYLDPTTVIDTLYDRENSTIYVMDEYYERGKQLDEVSAAMAQMNLRKQKIYMDAAEPRSIEYFRKEGYNAVPCIKGRDSVKAGLTFLQNNYIVVLPSCENFIMELQNFSYEKDKNTGKYKENSYTHEYSHAIDACRYAYSDIYSKNKLKTLDKNVLGL